MNSWEVAKVTVRLGDHNIKTNNEVQHIEKRVKRIVRHRGFDSRTLVRQINLKLFYYTFLVINYLLVINMIHI